MNPAAILALLGDLYEQVARLRKTDAEKAQRIESLEADLTALRQTDRAG